MRAAAAARVAEADLVRVYERFSADGHSPVDVLAGLEQVIARVVAFADFATARIEALTAEQWAAFSPRTAAEVDLFRSALRDAGRLLTETARLGLDARALDQRKAAREVETWATEITGQKLVTMIERSLKEMELTEHQWALARVAFPKHLRAMNGPTDV